MTVNYDDWQEVVNGPDTFAQLASDLRERGAVIVGWTDLHHTHHDVLLTLCPRQYGSLQGGLRGRSDLFVSVMRRGCFGFDISSTAPLHPGYVGEKLGDNENSPTVIALAGLISGVIEALGRGASRSGSDGALA